MLEEEPEEGRENDPLNSYGCLISPQLEAKLRSPTIEWISKKGGHFPVWIVDQSPQRQWNPTPRPSSFRIRKSNSVASEIRTFHSVNLISSWRPSICQAQGLMYPGFIESFDAALMHEPSYYDEQQGIINRNRAV